MQCVVAAHSTTSTTSPMVPMVKTEDTRTGDLTTSGMANDIAEYFRAISCKDVKIEPPLIPIDSEKFQKGNNADNARLGVSARGLWSTFEKIFVDVRIFNPYSESYKLHALAKLYIYDGQHENQKKIHYFNRILQVEKGTFPPRFHNNWWNGRSTSSLKSGVMSVLKQITRCFYGLKEENVLRRSNLLRKYPNAAEPNQ